MVALRWISLTGGPQYAPCTQDLHYLFNFPQNFRCPAAAVVRIHCRFVPAIYCSPQSLSWNRTFQSDVKFKVKVKVVIRPVEVQKEVRGKENTWE